jgi:hypothetical protein
MPAIPIEDFHSFPPEKWLTLSPSCDTCYLPQSFHFIILPSQNHPDLCSLDTGKTSLNNRRKEKREEEISAAIRTHIAVFWIMALCNLME